MKVEDGASETARKRVIGWHDGTLSTRLNDKEWGVIILVMQRLHQEDLAGFMIERGGWHQLNLPAIATDDRAVPIGPHELHHRKAGSILHPERESRETLERIKAEIGSLQFSAQYQQSPVPPEGNLVKREWFKYYDTAPSPGPGVKIVQSWDIATTTDERNDWSVCTTWAIKQKDFYLLDVWRARVEFPALRRKIIDHRTFLPGAGTVLIEKGRTGAAAGPGATERPDTRVSKADRYRAGRRKVAAHGSANAAPRSRSRVAAERGAMARHLPGRVAGLSTHGRHDDQVDSVSQFLKWAWARLAAIGDISRRRRSSIVTGEGRHLRQPFRR